MLSYMGLNAERAQRLRYQAGPDRPPHTGTFRRTDLMLAMNPRESPVRLTSIDLCHPTDIKTEVRNMGGKHGKVIFLAGRNMHEDNADGGTRMVDLNDISRAQQTVQRLVSMMVVKRIMLGSIAQGYTGGKAMILGDPNTEKTDDVLKAFGEFLLTVPNFTTGTDLNMSERDMKVVRETAGSRIVGLSDDALNMGSAEETTAQGIIFAMRNMLELQGKRKGFDGVKIAVQGIGNVGYPLVQMLVKLGAKVYAYDIDSAKRKNAKDTIISTKENQLVILDKPEELYRVNGLEIFSPNAGDGTVEVSKFQRNRRGGIMLIGAANSPLASFLDPEKQYTVDAELGLRGIEYVPDFPINLGGLLHAIGVQKGMNSREQLYDHLERIIRSRLTQIREASLSRKVSLLTAAEGIAMGEIYSEGWYL